MIAEEEIILFLESEEDVKKIFRLNLKNCWPRSKRLRARERKSRKTSSKRFRAVSAMIQRVEVPLKKNAI